MVPAARCGRHARALVEHHDATTRDVRFNERLHDFGKAQHSFLGRLGAVRISAPNTGRFVRDIEPALGEEFLDVAIARREAARPHVE